MKTPTFNKTAFHTTLIAAALAAGLGLAGAASAEAPMPKAHSDNLGAAIADTAITAKVKANLMAEDGLKQSKIKVTTTNGVVTLEGSASSAEAKAAAETATKAVDGVKSVDNTLKTPTSSTAETKVQSATAETKRVASDSWITTKVKSEMLADSVSKGVEVSVTTLHGVVVLKGVLASQDAIDHVKDIAGKVKGVKSVDTSGLSVAGK